MDSNPFLKGVKNASIGLKRTVERLSVDVMGSVGLSNPSLPDAFPHYDHVASLYFAQTDALKALRGDAVAAFDAMARSTGTAHTLARRLRDALPKSSSDDSRMAAEALMLSQATVADEVLSRVERRVKKRVIAPADEELDKARDVAARVSLRKKVMLDAQRYRARVSDGADGGEDERKARDKLAELATITDELLAVMNAAMPRRATLLERAVAETIEFERRFYVDSARLMDRCIDTVGQERLAAIRGSGEETSAVMTQATTTAPADDDILGLQQRPSRRPSQQQQQPVDDDFAGLARPARRPSQQTASQPVDDDFAAIGRPTRRRSPQPQSQSQPPRSRTTNGATSTSLWDEDDDDDDDEQVMRPRNPFDEDDDMSTAVPRVRREEPAPTSSTSFVPSFGTREPQKSYPSAGVGKRESVGGYPAAGVGSRESTSAYPTGGSRQRENAYPTAKTSRSRPPSAAPAGVSANRSTSTTKPPRRNRSDAEADLLNFDEPDITSSSRTSRPKKSAAPPAAAATEDLLDLGSGKRSGSMARSASGSAMEGDLLGDFGNVSSAAPTKSRSMNPSRTRNPSPSMSASSSVPTMAGATTARSTPTSAAPAPGENLEREQLRKKHEAEIKARADEKLAAVREREKAVEKERDQKDDARGAAEAKVNQWMGNGARRGNLRALLASLDTVLYPGATWTAVNMTILQANPKVKINYHKAILQVHPDKIGSKNLPPDQQVLAELIFDELKNAYEVWTAEQEGRPPPPGSVGPKRAQNSGANGPGGFGNMGGMGRPGMYNNMGRGGMGMGGMPMGGMGRSGMGGMGMGGMGRGMGRGMGMGAMGGMPMGGRGMGGMYGAGTGRRGTGMGNMPQGFGTGRNTQQRR